MSPNDLRNRLRIAREVRGMTLNEVAERSGLNRAVVGRMNCDIGTGSRSLQLGNILAYCKTVGMPIEHMMGPLDVFAVDISRLILHNITEIPDAIRNEPAPPSPMPEFGEAETHMHEDSFEDLTPPAAPTQEGKP